MVIAAYLPQQWDVRLIDENIKPASDADYRWADAVLAVSASKNIAGNISRRCESLMSLSFHHFT